jgi:SAM-dependent methyltransferase
MIGSQVREAPHKTLREIASEWDEVAARRDSQIRRGRDVSYTKVLVPEVLKLALSADWSLVLDVGCGTGTLAELLGRTATRVVGVDISRRSIAIAQRSTLRGPNTKYVATSIERFGEGYRGPRFTLIIANMMVQTAPNLQSVIHAIANLLHPGGRLVMTVTHPCFWPEYWGYARKDWFRYERETGIEAPFRISNDVRPVGITTHFHRPLAQYFHVLRHRDLHVQVLREPVPDQKVQQLYPKAWRFPRFLSMSCVASPTKRSTE